MVFKCCKTWCIRWKDLNPEILTDFNITVLQQASADTYEMIIPNENLSAFKSYSNIKRVVPVVQPAAQYDPQVFPHNDHFGWNQDNFGPLVLPKRGWTVRLNDSTLMNYYWMMGG